MPKTKTEAPEKNDDNIVIFKGRKNGLIVDVCPDTPFPGILSATERKVKNASKFFGNEETALTFKGREFSDDELDKLLEVFTKNTNLNISYSGEEKEIWIKPTVQIPTEAPMPYKPVEIKEVIVEKIIETEAETKFMETSLRSGQRIEHGGHVIIWGDVNPGAEIIAAGHIIVLGALRGMVHAGCGGLLSATVTAAIMQPTQLRIANAVAQFRNNAESETYLSARREPRPMKAFIKDNIINITEIV